MDVDAHFVDKTSSTGVKIALFRSLFRRREDVYPRRFESRKTGRSGYAPACATEWVREICEKPRFKCAECSNRRFLAVTEEVIRWHQSHSFASAHQLSPIPTDAPSQWPRDILLTEYAV